LRIERFEEVLIGPDLGGTRFVERSMLARHQDDGGACELRIGFDRARYLVSIDARQRRVDECNVRREVSALLERSLTALNG
jgi:hypothetical protein